MIMITKRIQSGKEVILVEDDLSQLNEQLHGDHRETRKKSKHQKYKHCQKQGELSILTLSPRKTGQTGFAQ